MYWCWKNTSALRPEDVEIYGEVLGFGMSADAFHITGPAENGEGGAAAMRNALRDAELNPEDLGYLNAQRYVNAVGRCRRNKGVKTVFGDDTKLMVSSTQIHDWALTGAAGSVEAIYA